MTRILLGLLAAAVISALGLGWQVHRQAGAISRAEERLDAARLTIEAAQAQLTKDRALSVRRAKEAAAAREQAARHQRELASILRREAEWADRPIPPAVLEALK